MFQLEKCLCMMLFISVTVYADDYKVESISKTQYRWGHSPYWDVKSQTLYFADIYGGSVSSYKPSTKTLHTVKIVHGPNATASVIIPYEGLKNKFVVGVNNSVANLTWDGVSNTVSEPSVIVELTKNKTLHSHSGRADPKGRLWIGTIAQLYKNSEGFDAVPIDKGAVYMIGATGKVIERIPNISVPEGVVWNTDKNKLYFANFYTHRVELYDYDNESGNISNMRVIFDATKHNVVGHPAGMAMDTEGKLWITLFTFRSEKHNNKSSSIHQKVANGAVLRIDPQSGKVLRTLNLPTRELTSLVFGGKNLDVLYVTSSQLDRNVINLSKYSGRVFAITGLMSSGKPVVGYPGQRIVEI